MCNNMNTLLYIKATSQRTPNYIYMLCVNFLASDRQILCMVTMQFKNKYTF